MMLATLINLELAYGELAMTSTLCKPKTGLLGFRTLGTGNHPVVVLHGWFGDSQALLSLEPMMDLESFTYILVDVRGYGLSKELTGSFTIQEVAEDVLKLADANGWKTFSVVGHSMGGMMAQKLAAMAPDRVSKVIAVTPVPASGFPMDPDSQALFRGAKTSSEKRQMILNHTTGNRYRPKVSFQMMQHSEQIVSAEVFDAYLTAWAETDFSSEVKDSKVPMLVLVGAKDPAVTEALMKETILQWFPNSSLQVIADAGHYPMFETPWIFLTRVESFLHSEF
jgi:pimeloyl-ACP methyl ester carboxylesterase